MRDVAQAHILALEKTELTEGKRYIIAENSYWFQDILGKLKGQFPKSGYKFKLASVPDWMFSIASWFSSTAKVWKYRTGKRYVLDNTRSIKELGVKYTSFDETLNLCALDAIKFGFVKDKTNTTIDK